MQEADRSEMGLRLGLSGKSERLRGYHGQF